MRKYQINIGFFRLRLLIFLVAPGLTACGTKVPDIGEIWDRDITLPTGRTLPAAGQIEFEIKKRVYCDLKAAVQYVSGATVRTGQHVESLIPYDWGAQVSLSLQVDADSALSPGATFTTPMPNAIKTFSRDRTFSVAQSFGLNVGGTLSSTATRTDKFDPYWTVAALLDNSPDSICRPGNDPFVNFGYKTAKSSPLIRSDLGIKEWLYGALFVNRALKEDTREIEADHKHKESEAITYEIKFVIVTDGDVTPRWTLLRVSANDRMPLFRMGRTRTHTLIITLGPQKNGAPTTAASNTHLASQIGNSVSNANKALLTPRGFSF